ncbi:hypothetical protein [Actinoplanes sp. NPDC026619]|uniref:hypothetical protein n=1 Tax=Actinoplanes sp. NPDC026619 TaxID=3155798 RepID=UPI0033DCAF3A
MDDDAVPSGPVLDDEQFRRLAGYGEAEPVAAGRQLFASGAESYDFFLLDTAAVDIVRDATVAEPERLIYRGRPGDFLGSGCVPMSPSCTCRIPGWTRRRRPGGR